MTILHRTDCAIPSASVRSTYGRCDLFPGCLSLGDFVPSVGRPRAQDGVVEEIVVHGNRRIPADTIRARMFTRAGDVYDQNGLERDFNSLWNTGYFDDLRIEREETPKGWIIHVYVKEKPTIREIKYVGLSSVSQSDVLDKFKEMKVGLTRKASTIRPR